MARQLPAKDKQKLVKLLETDYDKVDQITISDTLLSQLLAEAEL